MRIAVDVRQAERVTFSPAVTGGHGLPVMAKRQFADIIDEVVLNFTAKPGVKVRISIEIDAESEAGFEDGLQRAVRENCNVLRFKNAEFD